MAISLDGVNNNDNFNKSSEGLFAMVTPRQDAVEAVTVTTAADGADVGGHGAVQIAFVTRSGTNRFTGSAYHYYPRAALNTNYWFNENAGLPKNDVALNQYGFRQGGPIVMPGLYDGRGKAFFFFNYEELRLPNNFTRHADACSTRRAQTGRVSATRHVRRADVTREVNVLPRWRRERHAVRPRIRPWSQTPQPDPRGDRARPDWSRRTPIRTRMSYAWQSPGNQHEKQPVVQGRLQPDAPSIG